MGKFAVIDEGPDVGVQGGVVIHWAAGTHLREDHLGSARSGLWT